MRLREDGLFWREFTESVKAIREIGAIASISGGRADIRANGHVVEPKRCYLPKHQIIQARVRRKKCKYKNKFGGKVGDVSHLKVGGLFVCSKAASSFGCTFRRGGSNGHGI